MAKTTCAGIEDPKYSDSSASTATAIRWYILNRRIELIQKARYLSWKPTAAGRWEALQRELEELLAEMHV